MPPHPTPPPPLPAAASPRLVDPRCASSPATPTRSTSPELDLVDYSVSPSSPVPSLQDSASPSSAASSHQDTNKLKPSYKTVLLAAAPRVVASVLADRVKANYPLIASRYPPEGFIVDFRSRRQRDAALRLEHGVRVRDTLLHLIPWTPASHAGTTVIPFKARVCVGGVPLHAHQLDTAIKLLGPGCLPEKVDWQRKKDKESACFNFWVWTKDPGALPKSGVLEIRSPPADDPRPLRCRPPRPLDTMIYPVLIHLYRVFDYRPVIPGVSPAPQSSTEQLRQYDYTWFLGVQDGEAPPLPPRIPARQWLGARKHDRSPEGGGNGAGESSKEDSSSSARK
ncbi:hypothetical protein BS78_10G222100 [Paspalum vaginatum]|nr:hypothetical protein BS78_10G222100 [Paspalum vaginatum]